MDIFRNLFFAYVATVVAFVSPLVPTSMRAKVKVPMASDLRNVSATASGSATIVDDANLIGDAKRVIIDDGAFIGVPTPIVINDPHLIGDAGRVIIDDGAFIGVPTPIVISDPPVLPCVDLFVPQTTTATQVAIGANPRPCPQKSATPTPTAPPDCYYEQMYCVQGGPIGAPESPCPSKLICKATGAPVPSTTGAPPGCRYTTVCTGVDPNGTIEINSAGVPVAATGDSANYFRDPGACHTVLSCDKSVTVTLSPTAPPVITPSCTPKPACIDAIGSVRCMMPEPRGGWCATKPPVKITISPTPPPGCKYETMYPSCAQFIDPQTGKTGGGGCEPITQLVCAPTGVPKPTIVISRLPVETIKPTIPTAKVPQAPTGLTPVDGSNIAPGIQKIAWNYSQNTDGFTTYAIRIDDVSTPWSGNCTSILGGDVCLDGKFDADYTYNFIDGHTYKIWVHAIQNGQWSAPTFSTISVGKVTPVVISPLPVVTLPPGCKYVEACKPGVYDQGDWSLKEITMQAAKSRVTSGDSCYTSVQCLEPTKAVQPTPTDGCFVIDECSFQNPLERNLGIKADPVWGGGFYPDQGMPVCVQKTVCPTPSIPPKPTIVISKLPVSTIAPVPSVTTKVSPPVTITVAPLQGCTPSVGVCGFNLNSAWAGASDITCQIPNTGKHGDIVTVSSYPSVCMGGYDTGTYKDAGKGQAQVKCENGKWKTFHPYYFWTYPGWNGCGTPVTGTLGSKSIILPIVTVAPSVVPKPIITISPLPVTTKVPPPVAVCDYAAPPNGCWYVKGTNYNTTTQCGMELKCDGVLPPVKITISPLPVTTIKPTVTLKPTEGVVKLPPISPKVTIVISPVPKDTLAPTPNLEMKKLQDQVDTLNKKLEAQSSELKQTNSLLKRMTDYLSNFFKFR